MNCAIAGFGVIEAANADEAVTLLQSQAPVDLAKRVEDLLDAH
jgi:hypothetical protein